MTLRGVEYFMDILRIGCIIEISVVNLGLYLVVKNFLVLANIGMGYLMGWLEFSNIRAPSTMVFSQMENQMA